MEATIQNKMRVDKWDAYTAKETLSYRGRKSYVSAARAAAKREEKQGRRNNLQNLQTNYWSPPIRRRDGSMKKQKRENEEKDRDTRRQETEDAPTERK